jgi:hypothetical protein
MVKMPKVQNKERILKSAREKCQVLYQGKAIRNTRSLSRKLKAKRAWTGVLQAQPRNNCHPISLYTAKLSFKIGEIKIIHDKHKLNQFMTTKP